MGWVLCESIRFIITTEGHVPNKHPPIVFETSDRVMFPVELIKSGSVFLLRDALIIMLLIRTCHWMMQEWRETCYC